jgi:hypothetical protein
VLAAGHHDDVAWRVLRSRAFGAVREYRPDDPAEEVAPGLDATAAGQGLLAFVRHAPQLYRGVHRHGMTTNPTDPTVLWRMTRGRSAAHATIFPGDVHSTVTWFFDGVMDRAERYDSIELAMARADEIRGILLRDGWKET